ncbi:helix-turn-helix domain-containing protein [Promicromonospora sp. Populi]|uniref:helix-turn-helix domain-containing protein n=1 Tax=Promicromonospora sp. Populi TaxID=3239420 RepID=UPI0034E24F20
MLGDVLGLTKSQSLAYRELVASPSLDAAELGRRLGCEPGDALDVLRTLESHGLAARQSGDDSRFQAAPPEIALGALLASRKDEIRAAQEELIELEGEFRRSSALRPATDVVDVVRGADAVKQRIMQLQLGARETVESFTKPPVFVMSAEDNTAEDQAVARGVRYRVVIDRVFLDTGVLRVDDVAAAVENGEDVRFSERVPIKLYIFDHRLAFVPIQTVVDAESDLAPDLVGALIIHPSGLLDALIALFEGVWRDAIPFPQPGEQSDDSGLDPQDSRILGLMLVGLTDQSVANQLGLSLRTVQRRVKVLMDIAGVSTRIQLGWHAARKGWI